MAEEYGFLYVNSRGDLVKRVPARERDTVYDCGHISVMWSMYMRTKERSMNWLRVTAQQTKAYKMHVSPELQIPLVKRWCRLKQQMGRYSRSCLLAKDCHYSGKEKDGWCRSLPGDIRRNLPTASKSARSKKCLRVAGSQCALHAQL